jgi:D-arabinose 5-phosphate isomerase GutQ
MSKQITVLLQPERREGETRNAYIERRKASQSYVASSLMGTLFWNTDMQGPYFNDARKTRPVGKSGHRIAKKLARLAREKGLHLTLDKAPTAA